MRRKRKHNRQYVIKSEKYNQFLQAFNSGMARFNESITGVMLFNNYSSAYSAKSKLEEVLNDSFIIKRL